MKSLTIMAFLILLTGCTSVEYIRAKNRENLIKLNIGMTKEQVLKVMGTKTEFADDGSGMIVNNPYRSEIVKADDGSILEILLYYTDMKSVDGAVTDDELTPIVISNGVLIGWGWSFLGDKVEKYQIYVR